jgi:hypothetical protein
MTRRHALAAVVLLVLGGVIGYKLAGKDAAPPADIGGILKERDALKATLASERKVNAEALAEADARAARGERAAALARTDREAHEARERVLNATPLDTGSALDLKLARHYPSVQKIAGGYFFDESEAGQAVRWVERYGVCVDMGAATAREALWLQGQIDAMATARLSLEASVAALEGHLREREALLERGKAAYEGEVAECRKSLRKARLSRLGWKLAAGGALGLAVYSAAAR